MDSKNAGKKKGVRKEMKFLIDTSPRQLAERFTSNLIAGQLQTPLTLYKNWGGLWAADNGAYSEFDSRKWMKFLQNREPYIENCLWVSMPDIVGNARRTLEAFDFWNERLDDKWPRALVAQDGIEDLPINWESIACIFIGGTDNFKESSSAIDLVKTAKCMNKLSHVGRLNTLKRYKIFAKIGADTCDGTGIVKYDHMLKNIEAGLSCDEEQLLFD